MIGKTLDLTFFTIFWMLRLSKKVLRLSKSLFRQVYSIKESIFDPSTEYQSVKLTVELYLTKKDILKFIDILEKIKKSYKIYQKPFFPYPILKFVIISQQNFLILYF